MLFYQSHRKVLIRNFTLVFLGVILFTQLDNMLLGIHGDIEDLAVKKSLRLPIREISGFSLKRTPDQWTLDIVSDHEPILYQLKSSSIEGLEQNPQLDSKNFRQILLNRLDFCLDPLNETCQRISNAILTQWEAVARDPAGGLALIQEPTNMLYVFNEDASQITGIRSYRFQDQTPKSKKSLGEGLVLLEDGHFLVAKEKHPSQIVEFGPKGRSSRGLRWSDPSGSHINTIHPAGAMKSSSPSSEPPAGVGTHEILEPLAQWQFKGTHGQCDISDLAVYDSTSLYRGLYVLSQQCNKIFLVELDDRALSQQKAAPMHIKKTWSLPPLITHAEALAVLGDELFVIGEDSKRLQDNVFFLEPKK